MGALIVNDANDAAGVAHQHHRLAADEGAEIIAGVFHLAFMADIDPGDAENAFELQFEDCRIGINLPVHAAGLDERRQILFRQQVLAHRVS